MRQDFFIADPEKPIRAELFSLERLESHAESLAAAQSIADRARRRRSLPKRLRENAKILVDSFREIAHSAQAHRPITPAGEWLLDNFHVVEEQIREIRNDLPADYYGQLPKLEEGPLAGYPRVYGMAWALVAHTDSAFDFEKLTRFVDAYQKVTPLTIGELWAIAVTLRLTLIENLRRLAQSIVRRARQTEEADTIADRVLAAETDAALARITDELSDRSLSAATISRLEQKLRDRDGSPAKFLHWMGEKIASQGMSTEQVVREEYQTQGAVNVSVRNLITSMRLLSDIDWTVFVESISLVDRVLSAESDFEAMEFVTRDHYRRAIEKLARGSDKTEIEVARAVITHVRAAEKNNRPSREREPGYYLVWRGRADFERSIGYRPSSRDAIRRAISRGGLGFYLTMFIAFTTAIVLGAWWAIADVLPDNAGLAAAVVLLAILPASDLAMALVNRLVTQRLGPASLPGMALRDGIPDSLRTLLAVPTLLSDEEGIENQIRTLEVHYLSNTDRNLHLALLTDWEDSDSETTPQRCAASCRRPARHRRTQRPLWRGAVLPAASQALLESGARQMDGLGAQARQAARIEPPAARRNGHKLRRHPGRYRASSARACAMSSRSMPIRACRAAARSGWWARWPIRSTARWSIPISAAWSKVMAFCSRASRPVCRHRAESSLFQWAFSGPNGLDPYAFAVSDVYQDLFEEGSYVGKGIYDIDTFEAVLHQRIPENTVLSHDLLEGTFARAALASDVEVVEEFPSRYDVEARRQHRWMRGDWQLLPWIFARGRDLAGDRKRARIPLLARWKMLDNLRRSLSAPAMLLALLWGWTLPEPARCATGRCFILAAFVLPPLLPLVTSIIPHRVGISRRTHIRNLARDFTLALTQIVFVFTFLARAAWLSLDAIGRTAFRLFISRRHMLEWVSFARSNYGRRQQCPGPRLSTGRKHLLSRRLSRAPLFLSCSHRMRPSRRPFLALWAFRRSSRAGPARRAISNPIAASTRKSAPNCA